MLILLVFFSCQKNKKDELENSLTIINSYTIDVQEPSGLTYDDVRQVLYTVSDNSNKIYKLSKEGHVFQAYNYNGNDLEGISIDNNGNLILAEERQRQIIRYNPSNNQQTIYNIDVEQNEENSGLEGVCYDSKEDQYFVLNEKNPAILIILNNQFQKIEEHTLSFSIDYSGICYDSKENKIWIVSDQSKMLSQCDKNGKMLKQYKINIDKAEGIAFDQSKMMFYLVSDSKNKLYQIAYPE